MIRQLYILKETSHCITEVSTLDGRTCNNNLPFMFKESISTIINALNVNLSTIFDDDF